MHKFCECQCDRPFANLGWTEEEVRMVDFIFVKAVLEIRFCCFVTNNFLEVQKTSSQSFIHYLNYGFVDVCNSIGSINNVDSIGV